MFITLLESVKFQIVFIAYAHLRIVICKLLIVDYNNYHITLLISVGEMLSVYTYYYCCYYGYYLYSSWQSTMTSIRETLTLDYT